jgi:hypothetical protein
LEAHFPTITQKQKQRQVCKMKFHHGFHVASAIWLLQRAGAQDFNFTLNATDSNSTVDGFEASCAANSACAMLSGDCCPTIDGVLLYCCYEGDLPGGLEQYKADETLAASTTGAAEEASYFVSSSGYFTDSTAPDGTEKVVQYIRNSNQTYDLIYYKTSAIPNASEFVTADKKFYMDVYTNAPPCTQILVQLDSLEFAKSDNYPTGRHSRYYAATTAQNQWERLQFDFLDRPDPSLGDDTIDAIAVFFGIGDLSANTFYFKNFDIATSGCTSECEEHSPKSCPAIFEGEKGFCADGIDNDQDGLVDCQDPECTSDPACTTTLQSAYATADYQASAGYSVMSWTIAGPINALLLLLAAFAL